MRLLLLTPEPTFRPRRPLVGLALAAVAGLLAASRWPVPFGPVTGLAAALLAVGSLARGRGAGSAALLAAVFAMGALHGDAHRRPVSARRVDALLGGRTETVEVIGRVVGDPREITWEESGRRERRCVLDLEGLRRTDAGWQRARGRAQLVEPLGTGSASGPEHGDRVLAVGPLRPARGGGLRPDARMRCLEPPRRLTPGGALNPVRACYRVRAAARRLLARSIETYPVESAVLEALVLGSREGLPREVRDVFLRTGTVHVFAISGLHVGLAAVLLLSVLRAAGVSRPRAGLFLLPMLTAYTVVTGLAASAVRALAMAAVYWSANLVGRRPDAYSSLAAAALAILAVRPGQIEEPGFAYSFVIVLGLLALGGRATAATGLRADPAAEPPRGARALARRFARGALGLAVASTAAWIAALPLTATFANLVCPVALAANLVAVPGAFAVVLCGALSLATGAAAPVLAEVFNHAARVFIGLMTAALTALDRVPAGHFFVAAPPVALVLWWYAAWAGGLLLRGKRRLAAPVSALAVAVAAGTAAWRDDRVRVEVMADTSPPAVFVDLPGQGDLLVDPGPAYRSGVLLRRLRARGVDRLGAVVLTCADADHAGALSGLLGRLPVDALWTGPWPGRSTVYRRVCAEAAAAGVPARAWRAGGFAVLPGGVTWEVLQPAGSTARDAESARLVFRLRRGSDAVLFAGRAPPALVGAMDAAGVDPRAAVLVVERGVGGPRAHDAPLRARVRPRAVLVQPDLRIGVDVQGAYRPRGWGGAPAAALGEGRWAVVDLGRGRHAARVFVVRAGDG